MELKEGFLQIILTVALSATFIIVFYFTVGTYFEGQLVKTQMENIVKTFTDYYQLAAGNTQFNACSALISPDSSSADAALDASNAKLLNTTYTVLAYGCAAIGLVFTGTWFIGRRPNIPFKVMATRSMYNLIAVGLVEYLFLATIITHHVSVDANTVSLFALESIQANV